MAEDIKKPRSNHWTPPSNSKLEADIAYFEARLSMLDDKPATCYQSAQMRAYSALEGLLSETLERIRNQQRKRRRTIRAKSDDSLEGQLDRSDIEALLAGDDEKPEGSETQPLQPASEKRPLLSSGPAGGDALPDDAATVEVPLNTNIDLEDESAESPTPTEMLEQEDIVDFDSDNIYLRNALFSENLSFLQEPEEVQDEWEDVGEAEIEANLGGLDVPVDMEMAEESEGLPENAAPLPAGPAEAESEEPQPATKATPPEPEKPTRRHKQKESADENYTDSFFDSWLKG